MGGARNYTLARDASTLRQASPSRTSQGSASLCTSCGLPLLNVRSLCRIESGQAKLAWPEGICRSRLWQDRDRVDVRMTGRNELDGVVACPETS